MTVYQLRKELEKYPDDWEVVNDDGEWGPEFLDSTSPRVLEEVKRSDPDARLSTQKIVLLDFWSGPGERYNVLHTE